MHTHCRTAEKPCPKARIEHRCARHAPMDWQMFPQGMILQLVREQRYQHPCKARSLAKSPNRMHRSGPSNEIAQVVEASLKTMEATRLIARRVGVTCKPPSSMARSRVCGDVVAPQFGSQVLRCLFVLTCRGPSGKRKSKSAESSLVILWT